MEFFPKVCALFYSTSMVANAQVYLANLSSHYVLPTSIQLLGQSEIGYFHYVVLEHENVPGCEVPMYDLFGKTVNVRSILNYHGRFFVCTGPASMSNIPCHQQFADTSESVFQTRPSKPILFLNGEEGLRKDSVRSRRQFYLKKPLSLQYCN